MLAVQNQKIYPSERANRTVLFIDVVESTRLIEQDENDAIARWRGLVRHIETAVLPEHRGRLVNSLGDGLLIDFENVRSAISAALEIQQSSTEANRDVPAERQMLLRMGIEVSDVIVGQKDVYGRGVMLGARLMTLAGPGEIVISADVHDRLTPVLDADVEDLGECYVKHLDNPVRAYRIGPLGPQPVVVPSVTASELLPTIAVVPFAAHCIESEYSIVGELLADEMIRELSRSPDLNVISRLSTTVFRGRGDTVEQIGAHLRANYVLSGVYRIRNRKIVLDLELSDAKSARIIWSERLLDQVGGVMSGAQELIGTAVVNVSAAILARELRRSRSLALPTLESYTLLMAAIGHMHRLSRRDFLKARELLQALIDRAGRQAIPYAWLARWHVLRVSQGWSSNLKDDVRKALDCTKRALDTDPHCSLALAMNGWAYAKLHKEVEVAQEGLRRALDSNPNDPLAWLLQGMLHAFKGEGNKAVEDANRALMLTPLDPHRHFFESLAATAQLSAGQFERALELAQRSLRTNRTHASTLRVITIAQQRLGRGQEARETVRELMRVQPDLTITGYLRRHPAADYETGREWADALRRAGVPQ